VFRGPEDGWKLSQTIKAIGSPLLGSALQTRSDCEYFNKLGGSRLVYIFSIGDNAKDAFASNPKNTIFGAKRLLGRRMDDRDVKQALKHL